jgi:hypothetical protein
MQTIADIKILKHADANARHLQRYAEMAVLDPCLLLLLECAINWHKTHADPNRYDPMRAFLHLFKPRLDALVGWGAWHPKLRGSTDYVIATEVLQRALEGEYDADTADTCVLTDFDELAATPS